jgi:hypothetical protein
VSWLWIFLPVALIVIAAVVGLPLWQSIWSRESQGDLATADHHDRLRHEAISADATPQSRPEHVHH